MGNLLSGKYNGDTRLDGKTVIITGGNNGIGKRTALELYRRGGKIILACRNMKKAEQAIKDIKVESVGELNLGKLSALPLDLESLTSVRTCAAFILDSEPNIELLINNAGIMGVPFKLTEDGYEQTFATNHLGHYLFTLLLLPRIIHSAPAKIINLSSIAHKLCNSMEYDNINMIDNYSTSRAYGRSKAANVLFTKELATRLKGTGVNVYAVHPGVVQTDLWQHSSNFCPGMDYLMSNVLTVFLKSPEHGAQTTLYCALSEEASSETGLYYADCKKASVSSFCNDPNEAKELFIKSAEYVNLNLKEFDPFSPDGMSAADLFIAQRHNYFGASLF